LPTATHDVIERHDSAVREATGVEAGKGSAAADHVAPDKVSDRGLSPPSLGA
jgi:hypothetical protein